jgi:hypothetical protein
MENACKICVEEICRKIIGCGRILWASHKPSWVKEKHILPNDCKSAYEETLCSVEFIGCEQNCNIVLHELGS